MSFGECELKIQNHQNCYNLIKKFQLTVRINFIHQNDKKREINILPFLNRLENLHELICFDFVQLTGLASNSSPLSRLICFCSVMLSSGRVPWRVCRCVIGFRRVYSFNLGKVLFNRRRIFDHVCPVVSQSVSFGLTVCHMPVPGCVPNN
ncbi:hypothetical protein T10_1389 [Trichinella papuae]|uniref:Uncharacterized protein n=1 Tax=Trichinella papuae TaxID=268474 RepID=A0A0V1M8S0_9BILA|nr:hypothetical protein T10_1389 [Trichinella papuae]